MLIRPFALIDSRELVSLSALDDVVEDQDVSVGLRLEDEDILSSQSRSHVLYRHSRGGSHLVKGLFVVQDLLDPVGELAMSAIHIQSLILEGHSLSCSPSASM